MTDKTTSEKKHTTSEQRTDKKKEVRTETVMINPQDKKGEKDIVTVPHPNENIPKVKLQKGKEKFSTSVIREKAKANQTQIQKSILRNDQQVQKDTANTDNKDITPAKENYQQKDTITAVADNQPLVKDTAKKDIPEQPRDSIIQKKKNQKQGRFLFAAGIGEQQQIPVAGQTAVPYSSYGRKGSFSDYIPLVYIQIQRERKWFVQAEFRYGAAQSVKEFSYNRQTKYDTTSSNVTVTTLRLKKTYYHQLPLSFNYYLKPNFSIGIGGIYSRFYRAITEREIQTLNVQTQAATSLKEIIPIRNFTDSFLYKTQVHVLMQADYQWRKFVFGLRYTKDVQPYIKYTRPDGTVIEEKNQSLQLIVRYRLWKSRNF